MKTYIFKFSTNYNLGIVVVTANSLKKAQQLAKTGGAWDIDDVTIIDHNTKKEEIVIDIEDIAHY